MSRDSLQQHPTRIEWVRVYAVHDEGVEPLRLQMRIQWDAKNPAAYTFDFDEQTARHLIYSIADVLRTWTTPDFLKRFEGSAGDPEKPQNGTG